MIRTTIKNRVQEDICLHLSLDNHPFGYLCDCGLASDLTVRDCRDTAAIFISHTHIDHFVNFDGVMRHQLAVGRPVIVCGPAGLAQHVQHKLLSFSWNLLAHDDFAVSYEVRELHRDGSIQRFHLQTPTWLLQPLPDLPGPEIYRNEVFAVTAVLLDHGIDCAAYRFACHPRVNMRLQDCPHPPGKWIAALKEAHANSLPGAPITLNDGTVLPAHALFPYLVEEPGFVTCFVMDHAASPENLAAIQQLCASADEVYVEAYYSIEDREMADKNRHSMAAVSGAVLRQAGVRHAVPVHFSRRYQDEAGQALLLAEFAAAFEGREVVDLPA